MDKCIHDTSKNNHTILFPKKVFKAIDKNKTEKGICSVCKKEIKYSKNGGE